MVRLQTLRCGCKVEGCGVQCIGSDVLLDDWISYDIFEIECDVCGKFYLEVADCLTTR